MECQHIDKRRRQREKRERRDEEETQKTRKKTHVEAKMRHEQTVMK